MFITTKCGSWGAVAVIPLRQNRHLAQSYGDRVVRVKDVDQVFRSLIATFEVQSLTVPRLPMFRLFYILGWQDEFTLHVRRQRHRPLFGTCGFVMIKLLENCFVKLIIVRIISL